MVKEIKKINISGAEQEYSENWCGRCDKYFCVECVDFHEVNFDIEEMINDDNPNPDMPRFTINWKGEEVCIFCFNQLVDKKNG